MQKGYSIGILLVVVLIVIGIRACIGHFEDVAQVSYTGIVVDRIYEEGRVETYYGWGIEPPEPAKVGLHTRIVPDDYDIKVQFSTNNTRWFDVDQATYNRAIIGATVEYSYKTSNLVGTHSQRLVIK